MSDGKLVEAQMRIKGMHCATCAAAVGEALEALDGVEESKVSLATEKPSVRFDPSRATVKGLEAAIVRAGYEVYHDQTTFTVGGMHCAACASAVKDALERTTGVSSATVDFALGRAQVEYDASIVDAKTLAKAVQGAGYEVLEVEGVLADKLARKEELTELRITLSIALALTVPVAIISMVPGIADGRVMDEPTRNWLLLFLSGPIQFYAGLRYYRGFYRALRNGRANMDTLVVIGTSSAWLFSALVTVIPDLLASTDVYFDTSAVIITLVLVGKYLELRARTITSEAITKLMALQPSTAIRIEAGEEVRVSADDLVPGDMLVVSAGERVPADGTVVAGISSADESLVTGESLPVEKAPGSEVVGGTVNLSGLLRVRATRVGRDTTLSRIVRLVEKAQTTKAPVERYADLVAGYFVPAVLTVALAAAVFWYFIGADAFDVDDVGRFSLTIFVAVLVIACPCALGLATPTAIVTGTGRGAQLGILIKEAETLERVRNLSVVVLDKTGTLTKGHPRVVRLWAEGGGSEDDLLRMAGSAERGSDHALSRAIVGSAEERGLRLDTPRSSTVLPGEGVSSEFETGAVHVGNRRLMSRLGVDLSSAEGRMLAMEDEGLTVVACAAEGRLQGLLGIADTPKPEAEEVIAQIKHR